MLYRKKSSEISAGKRTPTVAYEMVPCCSFARYPSSTASVLRRRRRLPMVRVGSGPEVELRPNLGISAKNTEFSGFVAAMSMNASIWSVLSPAVGKSPVFIASRFTRASASLLFIALSPSSRGPRRGFPRLPCHPPRLVQEPHHVDFVPAAPLDHIPPVGRVGHVAALGPTALARAPRRGLALERGEVLAERGDGLVLLLEERAERRDVVRCRSRL